MTNFPPTPTTATSTTLVLPTTTAAASPDTVPIEVTNAYDAVSSHLWTTIHASLALIPGRHTQQPAAERAVPAVTTYLTGIAAIPFPAFLGQPVAAATNPWPGIESLFAQLTTTPGGSAPAQGLITQLQTQVPAAIAAINALRSDVHLSALT